MLPGFVGYQGASRIESEGRGFLDPNKSSLTVLVPRFHHEGRHIGWGTSTPVPDSTARTGFFISFTMSIGSVAPETELDRRAIKALKDGKLHKIVFRSMLVNALQPNSIFSRNCSRGQITIMIVPLRAKASRTFDATCSFFSSNNEKANYEDSMEGVDVESKNRCARICSPVPMMAMTVSLPRFKA